MQESNRENGTKPLLRDVSNLPIRRREAVPYERVTIDGPFWTGRLRTLGTVTVPHVFDRFEGSDGGAFRNFDRVAEGGKGEHVGPPWFDGLVYESICGASKLAHANPDEALASRIDGYIGRIGAAQAAGPDGYLNTNTTLLFPEKRWGENGGNLRWQHDLYNAGCLVEAAVHHYRATVKTELLDAAVRFALLMCSYMGPDPRKEIVPAHSLPEDAFVELYRLFERNPAVRDSYPGVEPRRFLELASFWIGNRGHHDKRPNSVPNLQEYAQDHVPLLRQTEAVGHAVRATLLYAGMTSVGHEAGNDEYLRASLRLWENVTERKMHVTGGVGAMHDEEMFGPDYFLPNDAYLETCAAVGLAWWAHRLGLAYPGAGFADVFERSLYNNVLAGVSLEGNRFFYRNPLESRGDHHRWEWHDCPCCPPMLLKLLGGFSECIYGHDGSDVWVNHYAGSTALIPIGSSGVTIRQRTSYPWDGDVTLGIDLPVPMAMSLHLRIPGWCDEYEIRIDGEPRSDLPISESGYVTIRRRWSAGDRVDLCLRMPVVLIEANPYVEATRGRVAIQRGPIVYCIEGVDNPDVFGVRLPSEPDLRAERADDLLEGAVVVKGTAADGSPFIAVPYFAWDNRRTDDSSENPMRVWIPREGSPWNRELNVWSDAAYLESWDDSLYRICWSG